MSGGWGGEWQSGGGDWESGESHGGSASGYSYFHGKRGGGNRGGWESRGGHQWGRRGGNRGGWEDDGEQHWGYQQQQWSTAADDEDWGQESNMPGPMPLLATPLMGRRIDNPAPGPSYQNINRGGWRGNGGGGLRKRPRNNISEGGFRKRRQRDFDSGRENPGFRGEFNTGGLGEFNQNWGDESYGGYGQDYGSWGPSQIPISRGVGAQPPAWGPALSGDHYDEEDAYACAFDFGGGYEGGYEDLQENHYTGHGGWKGVRKRRERSEKRKKARAPEFGDDRLLLKKHRMLTQVTSERKGLSNAIRNILTALKASSEALSLEAKAAAELTAVEKEDEPTVVEEVKATTDEGENTTVDGETNATTKGEKGGTSEEEEKGTSEEKKKATTEEKKKAGHEEQTNGNVESASPLPPEILIGVVRVGPAQRKLLIKERPDLGSELVAVFKNKPTKALFKRLAALVESNLEGPFSEKATVHTDELAEVISVKLDSSECIYPINISCTSPKYGHDYETENPENGEGKSEETEDLLSEEKCVEALTKIRRVRWSKQMREDIELPIVRLFLDFANRLPGWKYLEPYPAEVLVHTVMEKISRDVRPSEYTISRVFIQCLEVIAEGLVLSGGPGMKDPCEPKPVDVFEYLTSQQAEDFTRAVQSTLRLIACRRLKPSLNLDP